MKPHLKKIAVTLGVLAILLPIGISWKVNKELHNEAHLKKINSYLKSELDMRLSFSSISFSIFPMPTFVMDDAEVEYSDDIIKAERAVASISPLSIFVGSLVISEFSLVKPEIKLFRKPDGQWNLPKMQNGASHDVPVVLPKRIDISGGKLEIDDWKMEGQRKFIRLNLKSLTLDFPAISSDIKLNVQADVDMGGYQAPIDVSLSWKNSAGSFSLDNADVSGKARFSSLTADFLTSILGNDFPTWVHDEYYSGKVTFSGNVTKGFTFNGDVFCLPTKEKYSQLASHPIGKDARRLLFNGSASTSSLKLDELKVELPGLKLFGSLSAEKILSDNPIIEASLKSSPTNLAKLKNIVPVQYQKNYAAKFLLSNLKSGTVQLINFTYKGSLKQMQGKDESGSRGEFNGRAMVKGMDIYVEEVNGVLEDVNGVFSINQEYMYFEDVSARFADSSLSNLAGGINDYMHNARLVTQLDADVSLGQFYREFLLHVNSAELLKVLSPVSKLTGDAKLKFTVAIDLAAGKLIDIFGDLDLSDVEFRHTLFDLPIKNLRGAVHISLDDIKVEKLRFNSGGADFLVDGTIKGYMSKQYGFDLKFDASGDVEKFAHTIFYSFNPLTDVSGKAVTRLAVKGTPDDMRFTQWAELTGTEFTVGKIFHKPRGVAAQEKLSGRIINRTKLQLDNLDIELAGSRVALSGEVGNFPSLDKLDITADIYRIDLSELPILLPGYAAKGVSGFVKGRASIKEGGGKADYGIAIKANFKNLLLDPFEQLGEMAEFLKLRGTVSGEVEVFAGGGKPMRAVGTVTGKNVGLSTYLKEPFSELNGTVTLDGEKIFARNIPGRMGTSTGRVSFVANIKDRLDVSLSISGDEVHLSDVVALAGMANPEENSDGKPAKKRNPESVVFNKNEVYGRWTVDITSKVGTVEDIRYKDLHAHFGYYQERYSFDNFDFTAYDGAWVASGGLDVRGGNQLFTGNMKVDGMKLEGFLHDVIPHMNNLTGDISLIADINGNGLTWSDFRKTLTGKIEMEMKDGLLVEFDTMYKVFSVINIMPLFHSTVPGHEGKGLPYNRMTATFKWQDGIAKTDNLMLEGDVVRLSGAGKIDVAQEKIDMLIGVKPFTSIDKVINAIPIAGQVLGGKERSLIVSYYRVGGTFDEPKANAVAAESIARKIGSMLERLLTMPFRIFGIDDDKK